MSNLLYGLDIDKAVNKGLDILDAYCIEDDNEPNRLLEYLYYNKKGYPVGYWDELLDEDINNTEFLEIWEYAKDTFDYGQDTDKFEMRDVVAYILALIGLTNDRIAKRIEEHYIC